MNTARMTKEQTSSMTRPETTLPEEERDKLIAIRESGDLQELRQRVLALRRAKWPLRAIGDPLGAPRSTVRMWETRADPSAPIPTVPECDRASRERGERTIRRRMNVPPADRDELKRLAIDAQKVRSRTPKTAPARLSADKLDLKIEEYIAREVPVKTIATHMGVTPRAVTARHERYQERKSTNV